jgi:hypothetical protein
VSEVGRGRGPGTERVWARPGQGLEIATVMVFDCSVTSYERLDCTEDEGWISIARLVDMYNALQSTDNRRTDNKTGVTEVGENKLEVKTESKEQDGTRGRISSMLAMTNNVKRRYEERKSKRKWSKGA